uniref:Uncharacterized protein n=1 Tax=Chlamydomonas euryale TaxID=1486919 RepID=A0A7R9VD04_9CHLO
MFPGVDATKSDLEVSGAKAPMVEAHRRAAGETLDIDALLSAHAAATVQPRDDHALRVQTDIAAATRGVVWLAPVPLVPAPPAPTPVPASALPIVSPLLGCMPPDDVAGSWHLPYMLIFAAMRCVSS